MEKHNGCCSKRLRYAGGAESMGIVHAASHTGRYEIIAPGAQDLHGDPTAEIGFIPCVGLPFSFQHRLKVLLRETGGRRAAQHTDIDQQKQPQ